MISVPVPGAVFSEIFIGTAVFALSFIALFLLIAFLTRSAKVIAMKGRLKTIGDMADEVHLPAVLLAAIVSVYAGMYAADPALVEHPAMKIWVAAAILVGVSIVAKLAFVFLDNYSSKSQYGGMARSLPVIKMALNFALALIALLLFVELFEPELGWIVTLFGALFMLFLFALFYAPLRNIVSGMQLAGRKLRPGDYIEIVGIGKGHLAEIGARTTKLACDDGGVLLVPNSLAAAHAIRNRSLAGNGSLQDLEVVCACKDAAKAEAALVSACAAAAKKSEGMLPEYRPTVRLTKIEAGAHRFRVLFMAAPNSDVPALKAAMAREIARALSKANILLASAC
jgi:small-conductance mechanosensitive channel